MEQTPSPRFFLGANSKNGFFSFYDSFVDPAAGDFLWVIKGGPGCGKSTFMKRIGAAAEARGDPVEYIHCSGDPDSLDAVYLPRQRIAYADGTSPHIMEAEYPGAASLYLDFGAFFHAAALAPHLGEIAELNRRSKALYCGAYQLLAAAAALLPKNMPELFGAAESEKLDRKVAGIAARELKKQHKPARQRHRFLSVWSGVGRLSFYDSLAAGTERIYILENELGLGHVFLNRLAKTASAYGYDSLLCHDPLEPEKPEALLLPECSLGFIAAEPQSGGLPAAARWIRLDALPDKPDRAAIRRRRRESGIMLKSAVDTLAQAKELHNELEAVYRPCVDFSGVTRLTEDHIAWLYG